jgi:hypothetical protein
MALVWDIVRRGTRTRAGRAEREYLLTKLGKVIRRRWVRIRTVAARSVEKLAGDTLLVAGALARRAADLQAKLGKKYAFVLALSPQEWAETVGTVINRGESQALRDVRGKVVERLLPGMKVFSDLYDDMVKLAKQHKGWKPPAIVSGVRTLDGREVADWMIVSEHPDGRVWIMAIIESKSISNTLDLVEQGEKPFGQHLWGLTRARTLGMTIEKVEKGALTLTKYQPEKIVGEVASKTAGSKALTTQFIGVAPRGFTTGELNKLAKQGIGITWWPWPTPPGQLEKMMIDLIDELAR